MADIREPGREPSVESARRAEVASAVGLLLQLGFFGAMLFVALWNGSASTFVAAFYVLGGVIIWLATLILYHQEKLVHLEILEAEQIDRDREAIGAEALFKEEREGVDTLLVARARLEWMRKWLTPLFGLLTSVYLIATGACLLKWYLIIPIGADTWPPVRNASVSLAFVGGVAFLSFLFSRYTVGMARIGEMWRVIRAGGSYLTGNALICGLTAAMLGFAAYDKPTPEQVFAFVIPFVMIVIGVEIIVNLVMNVYRPRQVGEMPRSAFDSRLLGLISEPGGIARTIADAVNYQFGFEVSKTWFYQLLQRWALVLVGAGVVILFLMTSVVIVEPGEQAVVERFGHPLGLIDGKQTIRALDPGVHLKLPWPIDRAYRHPVDRVRVAMLGFGPWKRRTTPEVPEVPELILWTNPVHGPGEELDFVMPVRPEVARVVAETQPDEPGAAAVAPAVNLIRINLPVMYRIRDLYQYAFNYGNPEVLIESAAYGELVKYVANKDLDTLMSTERQQASADLTKALQAKCDALKVGVEITFVSLQNVHPPQAVAKEFEAYLNAQYEKGEAINKAEGAANKVLSEAAGSRERAEGLAALINRLQDLRDRKAPEAEIDKTVDELERLFVGRAGGTEGVSGEAAEIVAQARAARWTQENRARGNAAAFSNELRPYRVSPRYYRMWKIVEVLMEGLRDVEKYIIARDGEVFTRYDATQREQIQLEDVDYNVPPG